MASKTREAIFSIFGETNLPPINTNASSSEISRWKQKEKVSNCYKRLFEKIDNKENSPLVLTRIIGKVLHKNSSTVETAFVVVYNLFILTINNIFYYLILFNFFLRIKLITKSPWNLKVMKMKVKVKVKVRVGVKAKKSKFEGMNNFMNVICFS